MSAARGGCVAVAPGRHAVRVATGRPGEPARLVAELPPGTDPRAAAAYVAGPDPAGILLVLDDDEPSVAGLRTVAAAVAVAGGRSCVVVDAGRSGTVVTRVRDGRAVARRRVPIGGDRLDEAVRVVLGAAATADDARRVRERLSLLPDATWRGGTVRADGVTAVLGALFDELVAGAADVIAGSGPVVLVGGVARTPLLAERLDAAGLVDPALVEVAPRPELAALLAAPALLPASAAPPCLVPPSSPAPAEPARRRRFARPAAVAALVGLLAAAATAAVVPRVATPAPAAAASGAGVLVQYGYRLTVPAGWEHTGGRPERRRSLLTRVGTPEGADLIAVERTPLGYDSAAEPDRARTELRAVYDGATAAGSALSGYGPAHIGGRDVVSYRQREGSGAVVEWFVLLDGPSQLSVGCRHTAAAAEAVRAACAVVVGSLAAA